MTPLEALAQAMADTVAERHHGGPDGLGLGSNEADAGAVLAALDALGFTVARKQDMADGAALRLLREALGDDWTAYVDGCSGDVHVKVWTGSLGNIALVAHSHRLTIAAAADACRAAIEARR